MAKKVYIAELDAHTATLLKKIDDAANASVQASNKMTAAFNKVGTAIEKDFTKSSNVMSKFASFSKRDLGMLSTQMLTSIEITGKLGSQLSNLASGLLYGGFIGGAFAGFAAIINLMGKETEALTKNLKELIQVKGPGGSFNIIPEKIPEAIALLRSEMDRLPKTFATVGGALVETVNPDKKLYQEAIKLLQSSQQEIDARQKVINKLKETGLTYTEKTVNNEKAITVEKEKQLQLSTLEYDVWKSIMRPKGGGLAPLSDSQADNQKLEYDIWKSLTRPKGASVYEPAKKLEEAQQPMSALVSLSNQMASNFSFAGHTFVGQLSQAIAMIDSISNMILTIASMFGAGGGGFGIGGLLGLIGLEKGGRVTNKSGVVNFSQIPSFAMGGSYSTPAFSGPMGGGYPVMVHKNETLDVYNSGQTSRLENKLDGIKNAVMAGTLASTRKRGGGGQPINITIGRKVIARVVQEELNKMTKSGYNLNEF